MSQLVKQLDDAAKASPPPVEEPDLGAQLDSRLWDANSAYNPANSPESVSAAQTGELGKIDIRNPAPIADRAAVGIKFTPQGKVNYLKAVYGADNAVTAENGDMYFREPGAKDWRLFQGKGFNAGDVAEAGAPMAIEAAPTLAAGTNPLSVGAAAMAGSAARQGVSALLPGADEATANERIGDVLSSGALGAMTQGGVNSVGTVIDALRPTNLARRGAARSMGSPRAAEGEAIERGLNRPGDDPFNFSVGQLTGDQSLLNMEGYQRRNPFTAQRVQNFDEHQTELMTGRLNRALEEIRPGGTASSEEVGNRVQGAFRGAVDAARAVRRGVAARDFAAVDAAGGGAPVIGTNNIRAELGRMIDDFDVPGGGDAVARLVGQLRRTQADLAPRGGTPAVTSPIVGPGGTPITTPATPPVAPALSGQRMNRLLQIYNNAAQGTGAIFQDLDSAQQRLIAGRLRDAALRDLDAASAGGGIPGDVADTLRTARNNYRANSARINQLGETALGRFLDTETPRTGESVAKQMTSMAPSDLRATVNILQAHDPDALQSAKRFFIENAVQKATPEAYGTAGPPTFSAARFLKNLPPPTIARELFRGMGGAVEYGEIRNIAAGIERMANRARTEGSPTGTFAMWADAGRLGVAGLKNIVTLNLAQASQDFATLFGPMLLPRVMFDPAGRDALRTVVENQGVTGQASRKVTASVGYLAETYLRDELKLPNSDQYAPMSPQQLERLMPNYRGVFNANNN